jgi:hypothetical protein
MRLVQVPDSAYHFHLIHDEGGETCTLHLQPVHFDWTDNLAGVQEVQKN